MSYQLGVAKIILDGNAQPALDANARVFKDTTDKAAAETKIRADQLAVQAKDIKAAAQIIISENKQAAAESVKLEKARVAEIIATRKVLLDANKRAAQEEADAEKEYQRATKEARKIEAEEFKAAQKAQIQAEKERKDEILATRKVLLDANKSAAQEEKDYIDKIIKEQVASEKAANKARTDSAKATFEVIKKNRAQDLADDKAAEAQRREEFKKTEQARKAAGFLGTGLSGAQIGGTIATLSGFGAIASGAIVARSAVVDLIDTLKDLEEANNRLKAGFGQSAPIFKEIADSAAAAFQLPESAVERGVARFGILRNQFNLTSKDIRQMTDDAIRLSKVFGYDLDYAFKALSDAAQGETQTFENLGISLQENAIKGSTELTAEQRKNYSSMTASQQAAVRLELAHKLLAKTDLSAAENTESYTNKVLALQRSYEELKKTALGLGGSSLFINALGITTDTINAIDAQIKRLERYGSLIKSILPDIPKLPSGGPGIGASIVNAAAANLLPPGIAQALGAFDEVIKKSVEAQAATKAAADRATAQAASDLVDINNKITFETEVANTEAKKRADFLITQLHYTHDREIERLNENKRLAEIEKNDKLDALKVTFDAEKEAREETEYQRKLASQNELHRIEAERDAKLDAIKETLDATKDSINAEKNAVHDAAEEQIRGLEIARDRRLREIEKQAEDEKDVLEDQKREKDRLLEEDRRSQEDNIKKLKDAQEDKHKAALRQINKEKEDESDKSREILRGIDDQSKAEDNRHRKALTNIDKEKQAALDSIDSQIRALDDAQRAEDASRRTADLQSRVGEARKGLTQAQGSGSPQQLTDARSKLTAAIRIGDPVAVQKAQQELLAIAGRGTAAIEEAQTNLAKAEQDLRDEGVKNERDAQKQKLQDAKDRITREAQAEKDAEDERDRKRKERLDKDKRSEQDRLERATDRIKKQTERETDADEKAKRRLEAQNTREKRALQDRNTAEDNAHKDALERINERQKNETQATHDIYDSEEKGLIPAIKRAKEAYDRTAEARIKTAEETAEKARKAVENEYNAPVKGIIAQHNAGELAAEHAYHLREDEATKSYERERQKVEKTYRNGKDGILDIIDSQVAATHLALANDLLEWDAWKNGVVTDSDSKVKKTFKEIDDEFKKLIEDMKARGSFEIRPRLIMPGQQGIGTGGRDTGAPRDSDGRGSPTAPPPPPGSTSPGGTTPGTGVPHAAQVNQYSYFGGYPTNVRDSTCGPAAIAWFEALLGNDISPEQALEIAKVGGWNTAQGMSGGPDGLSSALKSVGIANRVIWNPRDDLIDSYAQRGIPFAMSVADQEGGHYYQVQGGSNSGLNVGGSGTALRVGSSVMSLGTIRAIRGGGSINALVIPDAWASSNAGYDPLQYRAADAGALYTNPTLTMDAVTGQRGILAEFGPELLLGRLATAALSKAPSSVTDYSGLGAVLAGMPTSSNTTNSSGDTFNYRGVGPESIFKQWRDDQRRQRVLRG